MSHEVIKRRHYLIFIVDDLKEYIKNFIYEMFDEIIPCVLEKGLKFQIRFTKDEYEKDIPEWIKETLKRYAIVNEGAPDDYKKTFFWKYCGSYIFNYKIDEVIVIYTRTEWSMVGFDYDLTMIFVKRGTLPDIILRNIHKDECDKFIL